MATDMNILNGGYRQAVIWQTDERDGLAEPAIQIRTYLGGIIKLRQGDNEILINTGSVKELNKVMKLFGDEPETGR